VLATLLCYIQGRLHGLFQQPSFLYTREVAWVISTPTNSIITTLVFGCSQLVVFPTNCAQMCGVSSTPSNKKKSRKQGMTRAFFFTHWFFTIRRPRSYEKSLWYSSSFF
jgi:hypothetical protein